MNSHTSIPKPIQKKRLDPAALADAITNQIGSWNFIIIQSVIMAFWFLLNSGGWFLWHWDPYPFVFLNLFMSMEAAYATPIILMSGNRQQARDELQREMDSKTLKRIEQIESTLDKHVNTTAQEHSKQLAELRLIIGELHKKLCPESDLASLIDDSNQKPLLANSRSMKSPKPTLSAGRNGQKPARR